jgi:hypothetical protein
MSVPASQARLDEPDTPTRLDEWPTAGAWVDSTLASRGLAMVGPPQTMKVRPWSSVAKLQVTPHANGSTERAHADGVVQGERARVPIRASPADGTR